MPEKLKELLLSEFSTVPSLCVSALWMEILWKEDSGCGMNFNVNTKTAGCDLSRQGSASRSKVQFIQTSEPHQLESGLQKTGEWAGRRCEGGGLSRSTPASSKITDHSPKYGQFTKLWPELWLRLSFLFFPTYWVSMWGKSSVLNPPAGICSFGQLWLLSGYYSAQQRMAEHRNSSWQSHQWPMPSLPLHISATQKQPRLFIYNLLWKSPILHCGK